MCLPRLQEPVVHPQVHLHDQYLGHRRRPAALRKRRRDSLAVGRLPGVEQQSQGVVDPALSFLARQAEDLQVIPDGAAGPSVLQHVVGDPEPAGRKHRVAVAVFLERSGLAHQPVDDVTVLDAMLPPATKPRQGVDLAGAVPDLQGLGHDVNLHPLTDQSAGQRVDVAADVDRAPRVDPCLDPAGHLQPAGRQGREHGAFLGESLLAVDIATGHDLAEEGLILAAADELAAPPQHERLVDGLLEPVMALLDVAVLVRLARLDRLGFEAVVPKTAVELQ